MSVDWRRLSRKAGFLVAEDTLTVQFADGRRQQIQVDDAPDGAIRIWSVVAKPSILSRLADSLLLAWRRNRLSEFVGFTIDSRGRMIGESWVPEEGMTEDEWSYFVHNLAKACDRFEYLLTGADEQ